MKNEQILDFGVHLAPLAADDAIVTTAGSVATDNTRLTTAKSGRVCVLLTRCPTYPSILFAVPPSITPSIKSRLKENIHL